MLSLVVRQVFSLACFALLSQATVGQDLSSRIVNQTAFQTLANKGGIATMLVSEKTLTLNACGKQGEGRLCCRKDLRHCLSAGSAMRIHFPQTCLLEKNDSLHIILQRNDQDVARQIFNQETFDKWHKTSAFFNGHTLRVEGAGPSALRCIEEIEDNSSTLKLEVQYLSEIPLDDNVYSLPEFKALFELLDSRQTSTHPAIGRLFPVETPVQVCTGFLSNNWKIITAGHCLDNIKSRRPVFELNVPPSRPSGELQHSDPSNQFPLKENIRRDKRSATACPKPRSGHDWGVLCSATALPKHARKYGFRISTTAENDAAIKVAGYSAVINPRNRNYTLQSASGRMQGEIRKTYSCLSHNVYTTFGNSGSPVYLKKSGDIKTVIGIHVANSADGNKAATAFNNPCLRCVLSGGEICARCQIAEYREELSCN